MTGPSILWIKYCDKIEVGLQEELSMLSDIRAQQKLS